MFINITLSFHINCYLNLFDKKKLLDKFDMHIYKNVNLIYSRILFDKNKTLWKMSCNYIANIYI